ncbi:MAG: fabF-2 [Bacteriovoracaceae bacterium]|nr:fabF-2 [Bacteriovoracaceae bacterium]
MSRRVAVTGISVVSALGAGRDRNWSLLIEGKSGIGPITHFNPEAFKCKIAGEVRDFKPETVVTPKELRLMDFFIQYAAFACHEAMLQSGLVSAPIFGADQIKSEWQERAGSIIGCGLGGLPEIEATSKILSARGPSRISPFFITRLISNLAAGHAAIAYGLKNANFATTSACSSGAHAIGESYRMIKHDYADIMLAGGTESTITELGIGGFDAMRALSTRNDEPQKASRPFDKDRNGFVCGEGAGILVLEEWDHAIKRGAKPLAEVVGYAANCDAYHVTAPSENGAGAGRAMVTALKDAKLNPSDILAINCHGTSTSLGDIAETKAIKLAFKDHAKKIKISATKSMTGHCLGAAGGIEAVFTVLALQNQKVPPTINLDQPDPECDLDYVPKAAQDLKHDYALSNSFGFGGTNACLIFRKS